MGSVDLIALYESYPSIFPKIIKKIENNRAIYHDIVEEKLFSNNIDLWKRYLPTAKKIIAEKVYNCVYSLDELIHLTRKSIEEKYFNETDIDKLREKAIEAEFLQATQNYTKQLARIKQFRTVANGFYEK
ncbi:MAG: hypothetical protein ACYDCW_15675 [Acidithiobacillus ferrivorans]